MESVAEVTYLMFIQFRVILFLLCHGPPTILPGLLFSLLENKYNCARSTLLQRISSVKPRSSLKKNEVLSGKGGHLYLAPFIQPLVRFSWDRAVSEREKILEGFII